MSKNFCKVGKRWCSDCTNHGCIFECGKCKPFLDAINYKELKTCPKRELKHTKTVKELMKKTTFDKVFNTLIKEYPDMSSSRDGFKKVWNELLRDIKATPSKYILYVYHEDNCLDSYVKVHNNDYPGSYEFMDWSEALSMNVDKDTLKNMSPEEILSSVLFEITYFGFSEDKIKKTLNSFVKN